MAASLEDIFDQTRFQSFIEFVPLFFYCPLGICLATVRFFMGIHAFFISAILSKIPLMRRFILRILCLALGFVVIEQRADNYDKNAKVIVSNHITNFDHLAINLIKSPVVPSVWDLPHYLIWILGYTDFGVTHGRQVLIQNVKNFIEGSQVPVLVFPEGATTNGKKGLLKFSSWPFSLKHDVQPVIIQVHRPALMKIAPSVLGSRWWSDIFWFLFVPYTIFLIRYLPVVKHRDFETVDKFCDKVQSNMCKGLGVESTCFTSADKVEYAKRLLNCKFK